MVAVGVVAVDGRAAVVLVAGALFAASLVGTVQAAEPGPVEPLAASAPYDEAVATLGACPELRPGRTWRAVRADLAQVGGWREVVDAAREASPPSASDRETDLVTVTLKARDPSPGPVRRLSPERVEVERAMIPGLDWALRSGAKAYVAVTGGGDALWAPSPRAAYVLVRHPDGRHFFAGGCSGEALTSAARAALGSRYDRVLSSIVGLDGPDVAAVLAPR